MDHPAKHRFLIAPLDWGLGHATRCIPIARALLAQGQEVVVAATGARARLLAEELPGVPIVPVVDYGISYAGSRIGLYLRFPWMLARVAQRASHECHQLQHMVRKHRIDCVISDNRFGFHTHRAYCVYVTHQLCIQFPAGFGWLEWVVWKLHRGVMAKFDEVWVPDYPGEDNLTGDLSRKRPLPPNCRFVGPLSRLAGTAPLASAPGPDLLVLLSGPEPQRSLLEARVLAGLERWHGSAVVVRGVPGEDGERVLRPGVTLLPHLNGDRLGALMRSAKAILCRGGYTTIMELVSLGRTAVLVPTPGQTEQEYLCGRLAKQGRFVVRQQTRLDLAEALSALAGLQSPGPLAGRIGLLGEAVNQLLRAVGSRQTP